MSPPPDPPIDIGSRCAVVEDHDDPRLAAYRSLAAAGHAADREVRSRGTFLVEGRLVFERLVEGGLDFESVFLAAPRVAELEPLLARLPREVPVFAAAEPMHRAVTGIDFHQGVLAIARAPEPPTLDELARRSSRLVVLEGVINHDNLGAIFRNVAALGGDRAGVVLDPRTSDPLYRKSIRVSMGWAARVPCARCTHWPEPLADLARAGWRVLALTPAPDATNLARVPSAPGDRIALLCGTEGEGLSPAALDAATERIRIAMTPGVDSLNVATSVAIALHRLPAR